MPIVTLTTDFGWKDYYVAVIKGAMLSQNRDLNIIDITHDINNYDIVQAAFIFRNAWSNFPKATIHVLSVNDFNEGKTNFLAIRHEGHYFIGPDNGVFSLVFGTMPKEVYRLDFNKKGDFPLKDIYAKAVGHLAHDRPFQEIGLPAEETVSRITFQPVIGPSQIKGTVIHVDKFENVFLNIPKTLFKQVGGGRSFSLYFKRHDPIKRLSRSYHDVPVGEVLTRFNSAGYLEIAINMGNAASLLGLNLEDTVQIDFRTKES
ncbi:MAG: hypothetical protein DHS20C18_42360 [Saprospiraceae bacterium]|nr:MAG: hypothetical protein DHS20C18_42360 [Saprospiraceae bacterium]